MLYVLIVNIKLSVLVSLIDYAFILSGHSFGCVRAEIWVKHLVSIWKSPCNSIIDNHST